MHQYAVPATQFPARDLAALEDEITELAAHLNAATHRLLTLIYAFDERHGWSCEGMNSCAHWLNWKCGINLGAAREKVRVAHALCELNWYTDDDGSYVFRARLSPEQGARIAQSLNVAMDTIHEEQRNAAEDVSAETSGNLSVQTDSRFSGTDLLGQLTNLFTSKASRVKTRPLRPCRLVR